MDPQYRLVDAVLQTLREHFNWGFDPDGSKSHAAFRDAAASAVLAVLNQPVHPKPTPKRRRPR
jgi:hypothetical protein